MKFLLLTSLIVSFGLFAAPRKIEISTTKVGEAVHWTPEKIEVKAGEKIEITAKHDLEGGFDFHGLMIPELKISETVQRHKPLVLERDVPKSLKPGEYKVSCQFHPKHVPATLVVK